MLSILHFLMKMIHSSRDGKKFFAKEIRVDKDEHWKTDILLSVLEVQTISKSSIFFQCWASYLKIQTLPFIYSRLSRQRICPTLSYPLTRNIKLFARKLTSHRKRKLWGKRRRGVDLWSCNCSKVPCIIMNLYY